MLCRSVVSWVEAGLRKAAIGSFGGSLGTEAAAALGIEPVTSSFAGVSLPPLVLFRIAKKPNARIATTAIPLTVRRLGVSHGTAKRCCIIEPPVSPWRRAGWEFYRTALSERRGGLEFGWEAKPETDTFGHEPALVARTCSPANLLGLLKFVGTSRCNDARRCHPFAWHSQAAPTAMA